MDELNKKLREQCEGFNWLTVYHSVSSNNKFVCIYTDKGLNWQCLLRSVEAVQNYLNKLELLLS